MLYIFCVWDAFDIRKTQEYLASNVFPYFKFCNTIIYHIPPLEYHQQWQQWKVRGSSVFESDSRIIVFSIHANRVELLEFDSIISSTRNTSSLSSFS
jgi:hypothetical protein